MRTFEDGYRAFGLLLSLNWDRALYFATIATALAFGAYIGKIIS
ncbi:MAG: hypothetical protein ABJM43_06605 [Paracoccaceae bacterium]